MMAAKKHVLAGIHSSEKPTVQRYGQQLTLTTPVFCSVTIADQFWPHFYLKITLKMDRSSQPGPSKSRRDSDRALRMDRSPSPGRSKSRRDTDRTQRMDRSPQPGPSKPRRDTDRSQRMDQSPQPGPSKPKQESDSDIELPEKDEEKEPPPKPKYDQFEKKIDFFCELCKMKEKCHYYGKAPPFATRIEFLEDCYVLRDPFAPPPLRAKSKPEYFLVLGSKCSKCNITVCKDTECSFFYEHTYCMNCINQNLKSFPVEVQTKVKKLLTK